MSRTTPDEASVALNGFLEEMASSYYPSLCALRDFETRIQSACKTCMSRHLPRWGRALGMRVSRNEIKDYQADDADAAFAGARLLLKDVGSLHVFVGWVPDEEYGVKASVNCTISLKKKDVAVAFWKAIARSKHTKVIYGDDSLGWFSDPIEPSHFETLDERLDSLASEWGDELERVGPLRELLGA